MQICKTFSYELFLMLPCQKAVIKNYIPCIFHQKYIVNILCIFHYFEINLSLCLYLQTKIVRLHNRNNCSIYKFQLQFPVPHEADFDEYSEIPFENILHHLSVRFYTCLEINIRCVYIFDCTI